MRPQLSDHSTHPDGDPFAARDALAAQNTPLGRLEARAIEEQRVRDGGAPNASSSSTPSAPAATRSQRRTSNLSASPKRPEVEIPVVVVEDSDDDEGVAASLGTMARASPELGAKGANGSVTPVPKSEDTDVVMGDARQAGQAGPDGGVAAGVSSAPASAGATTAGEASSHAGPSTGMDVPVAVAAAPTRAPRQRSPSPAAPVKPPRPPKTIRLEFEIPKPGDPVEDVPEYSIADAAIEAGYGVDETEAEGSGSGSGSGGSESESEGGTKKVKGKGKEKEKENGDGDTTMEGPVTDPAAPAVVVPAKRKRAPAPILGRYGGYDTEDSFVDDEDIALFEPAYYHRPKQEGYFICIGALELPNETEPNRGGRTLGSKNKPKFDADGNPLPVGRGSKAAAAELAKKAGTATGSTPAGKVKVAEVGAKGKKPELPAVIILDDDDELPSVSSIPAFGAGAMKPVPVKKKGAFSPSLQAQLDMLKAEVAKEKFEVKNKFPLHLRPILAEVALLAIDLNEYDDDFFAILPKIFPYNLFTMKKLVKREVFPKRIANLTEQQEEHMDVLRAGIASSIDAQIEEHEQAKADWRAAEQTREDAVQEKRHGMEEEILRQDRELDTPEPGAKSDGPTKGPGPGGDSSQVGTPPPGGDDPSEKEVPEPRWRFRMTDAMKMALFHIYTLGDEMGELIIEKQTLEKATEREGPLKEKAHSIHIARKALYTRIANLWPDDRMPTNQLSREVSQTKKKVDREKERAA